MAPRPAPGRLRLVILDLDGVVYRGDRPVEGGVELISRLHGARLLVRFATNNSMATRAAYAQRLRGMGIPAEAQEIVTSTSATIAHLRQHEPMISTVLAVGAPGMVSELRDAGYRVTPAAEADPVDTPTFDAVIAGLDPAFDDARLAAAVHAVRAGARFIATNADARYPTLTGFGPGAGAGVAAIRKATGVDPLVIGKPEPAMFRAVLDEAAVSPDEALVIGDSTDADIPAARRAGIESVLVLTGVTDEAAVAGLSGDQVPDHVAAGPTEVWDLIADRLQAGRARATRVSR